MPTATNIIWSISVHIIVRYPFSRQSIVRTNAELLSNGTNGTILHFLSDLDVILIYPETPLIHWLICMKFGLRGTGEQRPSPTNLE